MNRRLSVGGRIVGAVALTAAVLVLSSCRRSDPTGPGADPTNYPVESRFLQDGEGWTVVGDGNLHYSPAGGNPSSTGYIFIVDRVEGDTFYFNAPPGFLGDVSGAYGRQLSFDLVWSETNEGSDLSADDVILRGAGLTLVAFLPDMPGTTWTSYGIPLDPSGDWVHQDTEQQATAAEIQSALGSLQSLRIRGEFRFGPEQGGLDNVLLGAVP